jgi:hypothetical protein
MRVTRRFQRNYAAFLDYIRWDYLAAAKRVICDSQERIYTLGDYNSVGRTGSVEGTRELLITQYYYIVICRVLELGDKVQLLDIVHIL